MPANRATNKPVSDEEVSCLENKMVRMKPEAIRQFDILKAEQGPRSGGRLMNEALNLLFSKYGKPEIPFP